jgi:hypothetical protein
MKNRVAWGLAAVLSAILLVGPSVALWPTHGFSLHYLGGNFQWGYGELRGFSADLSGSAPEDITRYEAFGPIAVFWSGKTGGPPTSPRSGTGR